MTFASLDIARKPICNCSRRLTSTSLAGLDGNAARAAGAECERTIDAPQPTYVQIYVYIYMQARINCSCRSDSAACITPGLTNCK